MIISDQRFLKVSSIFQSEQAIYTDMLATHWIRWSLILAAQMMCIMKYASFLGDDRMNDYFDLDLFYGRMKVSVKSSYFRLKERPSFVVYGKKVFC